MTHAAGAKIPGLRAKFGSEMNQIVSVSGPSLLSFFGDAAVNGQDVCCRRSFALRSDERWKFEMKGSGGESELDNLYNKDISAAASKEASLTRNEKDLMGSLQAWCRACR